MGQTKMAKTAKQWLKMYKVLHGIVFFRKWKTKFNQISKKIIFWYTMNPAFNFSWNDLQNY